MADSNIPAPIYGLILAGGLSTRMGTDKHVLDFHGIPQYQHLVNLLYSLSIPCFIACRAEQSAEFSTYNCILDRNNAEGPLSPIRSALGAFPSISWLVLACDMPGITRECLQHLLVNRNSKKQATVAFNNSTNRPEPLLCIYESGIPKDLLDQYHSPSKLLTQLNIQLVETDSRCLFNINTPEEYQKHRTDSFNQG